jgi:putative addiction module component (TIGR02574 family)
MSTTMIELGIDRLDAKSRAALALEIWDSLGDERPRAVLSSEQRDALERRDRELDAHPEQSLTWEQIHKQVESKRELAD